MNQSPRPIPVIPACRERLDSFLADKLVVAIDRDTRQPVVARVSELLSMWKNGTDRVFPIEPLDNFPHFEQDVRRFFEHPIFKRPWMELSPLEIGTFVPMACMLSATERWITGKFTTTGLNESLRTGARESNLAHSNGMLAMDEENYDDLLFLLDGNLARMRELTRLKPVHDWCEYPRGDIGRSVHAWPDREARKAQEEKEALEWLMEKIRNRALRETCRTWIMEYEHGKPKNFDLESAKSGNLVAFLGKFADLVQGTQYGYEQIFPHYGGKREFVTEKKRFGTLAFLDKTLRYEESVKRHLDISMAEIDLTAKKILQLKEIQSPEKRKTAIRVLSRMSKFVVAYYSQHGYGMAMSPDEAEVFFSARLEYPFWAKKKAQRQNRQVAAE